MFAMYLPSCTDHVVITKNTNKLKYYIEQCSQNKHVDEECVFCLFGIKLIKIKMGNGCLARKWRGSVFTKVMINL